MSFGFGYTSPHACLGVQLTATAKEIRTAYRALARTLHPDKNYTDDYETSTAQFQELDSAYKACLDYLEGKLHDDWDYTAVSDAEPGPGETPVEGVAWWDRLTSEAPWPLLQWAKACAKAHRNSRKKMTQTERIILNAEYNTAWEEYEAWRIEDEHEEEQRELAARLEANLSQREFRAMMYLLDKKREEAELEKALYGDDSPDYYYGYDAVVDEEECQRLADVDHRFDDTKKLATGTWRDTTANKSESRLLESLTVQGAVKELENFKRQVQALEYRNNSGSPTRVSGNGQEQMDEQQKQRKIEMKTINAKRRAETEARLRGNIEDAEARIRVHAEKVKAKAIEDRVHKRLAIAAQKAHEQGREIDYKEIEGVDDVGLFQEAFVKAETELYLVEPPGPDIEMLRVEPAPETDKYV